MRFNDKREEALDAIKRAVGDFEALMQQQTAPDVVYLVRGYVESYGMVAQHLSVYKHLEDANAYCASGGCTKYEIDKLELL